MTSTPSTSTSASTTIPAGFSRRIKQSLKLRLQDEIDRDVTSTSGATTSAPIDVAACTQALSDILGYERKSRTGGSGVIGSSGVSHGTPTKTTIDAQSLRSVVERRGLALNESFLDASLRAQSKMTQVEATLRALDDARERMRFALDASNSKTAELLRESERAKENLKLIESRRDLVKSFAADFQLSKTFVEALSVRPTEDSSTNDELPQHFFQALERVKAIQANCAKLANTDQQRAGLELMDVMTTYAESAHEKLRRWVIAKCRILAEDDDFITERDEKTLQKAVETLRQRPLLFKACVEEVTRTRHNALFRRFITALTRGSAGTKPIEVHAHDPLRYVGDMLSWVHQAVASEKEFCTMAFGSSEDGGVVEIDGVAFDATQDVLKKVFDAVCRPLKVRVEQAFVTSSGSVMEGGVMVAYKLANLMSFYKKLLFDLLGDEATLTKTIAGLKESAKTFFSDAVCQHSGKFKKTSLAPSAFAGGEDAIAPPSTLREGVSNAMDLLDAVATTSTSSSGGSEEESKELLSAALDGLIDPIVQAVETAAVKVGDQMQSVIGSAASGPKWVGDAFALNCLNAIREPLRSHSSAGGKVEEISRIIARKVSDVADSEAGGLLAASGLSDALELVVLYQEQGLSSGSNVMANDPALKIDRLAAALSSLVDAAGTNLPDFAQVQSAAIRRDVTNRYNSKLIEAYSRVYAAVLQPTSGYPSDVRSRIRHGPDALSTVLGGA